MSAEPLSEEKLEIATALAKALPDDAGLVETVPLSSSGGDPSGCREVCFRWTVKRISDIDTSNQRFYVEFVIRFDWKAINEAEQSDAMAAMKLTPQEAFDWEPIWAPMVSFPNALDCKLDRINIGRSPFFTSHQRNGEYWVRYNMEVRAYFMEYFELRSYPFDCQDLTIIVKMGNPGGVKKQKLVPDMLDGEDSTFAKIDLLYSVMPEWSQKPSLLGIGATDPKASKTGKSYPIAYLKLKVQRKYQYYVKRMCSILAILSFSSLLVFGSDFTDVGDRMATVVTLELAIVAFQMTISDRLPVVSFLTFIDKYIMISMFYVLIVGIVNAAVYRFDAGGENDMYSFYALLALWLVGNAAIIAYVPYKVEMEKDKLLHENEDFEKSLLNATDMHVVAHHFKGRADQFEKVLAGEWGVYSGIPMNNEGEIVRISSIQNVHASK